MTAKTVAAMAAMQSSDTHANSNDRSVVVLKASDVTIRGNNVFMPILIEMSKIKKPERGQFKKVEITKEMTERNVTEKLLEAFPYLRNQRFYCAAAVDNRTRLDFNGVRRIWNGRLIKRLLKGNSALYIFVDEPVPGYANMAPQSEASSRTAVATATPNRVDLDTTLVTSSQSLPIGSSVHRESHCLTQPAQSTFCVSSVRDSQKKLQNSASPEQLTTKRPPEQMTTAENEPNQTFKKLKATKGVSNNTERNVAGDPNARTPLRELGTATVQERVSEIASHSYQTEGHLQNLSYGNADMKESVHVPAQFEPSPFVGHPNLAIQETKDTTMAMSSHSHPMSMSSYVSVKYPAYQMNSFWTSEHHNLVHLRQFSDWNSSLSSLSNNSPNVNTQVIQPMETDAPGVNQDLNSSASSRRWASSDKIAVSPDDDDMLESSSFYLRENDSSYSEIDFSNLIALSEMDDSELTSLLSPSGVDSSLTAQASNNVELHSQNQRHNTIQMPGPADAMQTQVSHVMRGNNSDSGLGSQSSSSASQSRHTSDMENSALEEYPAIIKIRPNAVGLSGAPSCEFLGLAELFPEVQSGYATVGNLEKEIRWTKGDKHGNGNCIPPSPKPGKQIVKIYSVTGRKLVEAELWYVDPCHHTDDECLVRVGEKASQSYEELCRVMSNILIRCRPQASVKSGESQYSGNPESSLIVQVLRFLINEAAESGLQWDSLPLLEFVAMNHDHENAAIFLEERTERYARDITPEDRERNDLLELLAAIYASHKEDEATDASEDESCKPDGRNDSDSGYYGDVESLCNSEEPTSDSEDDLSDMLRKVVVTENEIQMAGNNTETDEREILNLPSCYLSGAQFGEKETQPTHCRVSDSTVSLKESVNMERVSDQQFPALSDSMLPFGKNGEFSRKPIAIKLREKTRKLLQGECRISRIRERFNCEFPNLPNMKSVHQPIICYLLTITTKSINRCLSTMEDRWRIQLQLQRLSGRITTSPLSMLFQAMHIDPKEALKSLSSDAGLSTPSDNTSRAPFDSPLPSNNSTPSDIVALTGVYRPSGKILLSFVSDRKGFFPPESFFEDEDCELWMECWKWRRSTDTFLAVPLDIQARGPQATEVYNRELKEGQGYARRVPIMIIGQARTGKTSLKRSLKGELFDPNEGSTEGIETDPSYFKVTTDVWRTGSNSEDTETEPEFLFDRQLAQIIFKGLKEKERLEDPSRSGTKPSVKGFKVVEPSEANSPPTDSKVVDNANAPSLRTEVSVEPEELKTSSSVIDQIESDPSTQDSKDQQKVPENVAALVQELLKDNKKFMEGDDMYSVIWDFGGQSVFYDTRPIFLTEKAIYILAYDLSRDPYQKADAPVKQGMYEDIEDTDCQKTNFDYPDFWMSSIYSLVSKNTNRQKTSSLEKLPPVFLVCTHADEPYTKKGNPSKEIYGVLKDKIYRNLLKDFFVVDNTKSGSNDECQGVKKLRESVLSVAKDLPQMKEKIPLKWLKYEKVSYLLMSKGRERIFIEEARQVAVDECGIDDDVTFRTVLNFLHDQKVLINFNELLELESMVILNPQWLVDVFKEVITFKSFNPPENTVESFNTTENSVERLWKDFETTRILDTKVLDHTWGRFIDDQETCRSLIAIMERFSLLCPWPSQGTTELYLVPSMLRSPPTGDVLELLASARIPSLFVRFDSRRVPPGLFLRLILLFHKWSQERWMSPIKPVLFNNFALFHVCPHNATSLVVLCHSSSIEIVFCVGDGVGLAEEASFSCGVDLNVSRDIHRQMRLFLECMRKEFFWLEHMRYEMCVSCPVCSLPKESSKCRKHRVRGCDCLHLLSELEMQNLPYCKRPVVCGDRRIFKAMFVPWFSFLDEQEGRISLTKVCC